MVAFQLPGQATTAVMPKLSSPVETQSHGLSASNLPNPIVPSATPHPLIQAASAPPMQNTPVVNKLGSSVPNTVAALGLLGAGSDYNSQYS